MGSKIVYAVVQNAHTLEYGVKADDSHIASFTNKADAYDFIDLMEYRDAKAASGTSIQRLDPAAFRYIEQQKGTGEWVGYTGNQRRARFWFEADAIEWRSNDPLNKGTIGELIDREELRKVSDYDQFLINTAAKLNAISPQPAMKQAYIFLTCECELHGFNRAATSVRIKDGKFEVYGVGK